MVTMTEQPGQQQETEEFLCKWKELEDAVEMDISRLARKNGSANEDKSYLKECFEKILSALFDLDSMLSKAAAALPPFVQRKLTIAIKQLRTLALQGIRIVGAESKREHEAPAELHGGEVRADDDETMGKLSNLTGETRTLDSAELQDRAWMISDLKDCTIRICGTIPTLYLHRLSNCNIVAGPVAGATFGEDMQGCSLQLATHQLRLHSSTNMLVHVRAGSSPIIEHCSSVGFGPLAQSLYSDFEGACVAVQLPDSEHWRDVQDFLNPGSAQTSNWYMINE